MPAADYLLRGIALRQRDEALAESKAARLADDAFRDRQAMKSDERYADSIAFRDSQAAKQQEQYATAQARIAEEEQRAKALRGHYSQALDERAAQLLRTNRVGAQDDTSGLDISFDEKTGSYGLSFAKASGGSAPLTVDPTQPASDTNPQIKSKPEHLEANKAKLAQIQEVLGSVPEEKRGEMEQQLAKTNYGFVVDEAGYVTPGNVLGKPTADAPAGLPTDTEGLDIGALATDPRGKRRETPHHSKWDRSAHLNKKGEFETVKDAVVDGAKTVAGYAADKFRENGALGFNYSVAADGVKHLASGVRQAAEHVKPYLVGEGAPPAETPKAKALVTPGGTVRSAEVKTPDDLQTVADLRAAHKLNPEAPRVQRTLKMLYEKQQAGKLHSEGIQARRRIASDIVAAGGDVKAAMNYLETGDFSLSANDMQAAGAKSAEARIDFMEKQLRIRKLQAELADSGNKSDEDKRKLFKEEQGIYTDFARLAVDAYGFGKDDHKNKRPDKYLAQIVTGINETVVNRRMNPNGFFTSRAGVVIPAAGRIFISSSENGRPINFSSALALSLRGVTREQFADDADTYVNQMRDLQTVTGGDYGTLAAYDRHLSAGVAPDKLNDAVVAEAPLYSQLRQYRDANYAPEQAIAALAESTQLDPKDVMETYGQLVQDIYRE